MTSWRSERMEPMKEFGTYETDGQGRIVLVSVDPEQRRTAYEIRPGTECLAPDVFADHPELRCVTIPASLREIPDGCFSNGGGWASDEKGIAKICFSEENPSFTMIGRCFCRVLPDGDCHLIRLTGAGERVRIPAAITSIGEKAFLDCSLSEVVLEGPDVTIWFPKSHVYYLRILLEDFGRNGRLYDFSRYDYFLLDNHFNPERLRMACERIRNPYDMEAETLAGLKAHLESHREDILEALAAKGEPEQFEDLAGIGFFTEERIEADIEWFNRTDRRDLLSWLMNYKNSHFENTEFDFSI